MTALVERGAYPKELLAVRLREYREVFCSGHAESIEGGVLGVYPE